MILQLKTTQDSRQKIIIWYWHNVTKRYTQYRIVNWTIEVFASTKPNAIYQRQGMIFIVHNFMVFIHIIKGAITDFIQIVRTCMQICIDQCWLVALYWSLYVNLLITLKGFWDTNTAWLAKTKTKFCYWFLLNYSYYPII